MQGETGTGRLQHCRIDDDHELFSHSYGTSGGFRRLQLADPDLGWNPGSIHERKASFYPICSVVSVRQQK